MRCHWDSWILQLATLAYVSAIFFFFFCCFVNFRQEKHSVCIDTQARPEYTWAIPCAHALQHPSILLLHLALTLYHSQVYSDLLKNKSWVGSEACPASPTISCKACYWAPSIKRTFLKTITQAVDAPQIHGYQGVYKCVVDTVFFPWCCLWNSYFCYVLNW